MITDKYYQCVNTLFILQKKVIIGIYNPNISNRVDPDIPGKIIAEIATIPAKNT